MRKSVSIILLLSMLIHWLVPYQMIGAFAASQDGFTLEHTLWDGDSYETTPISATLGSAVKARLDYATASGTTHFFDVVLTYQLPPGTTLVNATQTGDVQVYDYDVATRTITYTMGTTGQGNQLNAGSTGYLVIDYTFNNPSPYPDGTTVTLDGVQASWRETVDGPLVIMPVESRTVNYTLVDSWSLSKTGTAAITVPNDPTVTSLDGNYTMALTGGNINLKDVVITDTLPPNATIVSSNTAYTLDGGNVIWHLPDVLVGGTNEVTAVLRYVIDRDGDGDDEGVIGGRTRTNSATVTGYPITTTNAGEIKAGVSHPFIVDTDTATTTFNASTATWGIAITPTATVEIPLNPSVTTVNEDYRISLTGGDITLKNSVITYTLPPNVSAVPDPDGGTVDLVGRTITWNYPTLAVQNHTWDVTLTYDVDRDGAGPNEGVIAGNTRDNTVSITGFPVDANGDPQGVALTFNPASATAVTTFTDMNIDWQAVKTASTTSYTLPNINADQDTSNITYTLTLNSTTSNPVTDNLPLESVVMTDTLPAFATLVSQNMLTAGTVNSFTQVGQVLTWNISAIPAGVEPQIQVVVKYNIDGDQSGNGVVIGSSQTNNMTVSANTTGATPIVFEGTNHTANRPISFVEQTAPVPAVSLNITGYTKNSSYASGSFNILNTSTYPGNKFYEAGDTIEYALGFNNTAGNQNPLTGVLSGGSTQLVFASLPENVTLNTIKLGVGSSDIGYKFYYTTNQNPETLHDPLTNGGLKQTGAEEVINIADLSLAVDERVTGMRIVYENDVPHAFSYTTTPKLIGTVKSGIVDGTDVTNLVTLKSDYMKFGGAITTISDKTSNVTFKPYQDKAWITKFQKTDVTNKTSYSTNEFVEFKIELTTNANYSTADLTNLTIIDIAPAAFDGSTFEWINDQPTEWDDLNGVIPVPTLETFNVAGTNQTRIKWTWADAYSLPEGSTLTLRYKMKFQSYAGIGSHSNAIYLTANDAYQWTTPLSREADTENWDDDAVLVNRLVGVPDAVVVVETPSLNNTKWVSGELDAGGYSKFPDVALTTPGGSADYKIEIFNSGNVPLDNIEIIDIFPYVGDTLVTNPGASRNSEWRPYLLKAIDAGELTIVKDMLNVDSKATLTVEYSTAKDPIRTNTNGSGTIGTETPNWTQTPPADITTVRSVKLTIDQFKTAGDVAKPFAAGETITLVFKMRAPYGSPYNKTAWNSVSMTGTNYGASTYLLRSEPNKVGIVVNGNPAGEIGDFVWFDQNGDGLQNDGYDDQNAGLNGITAILRKASDNTEFDRTLTSFDDQGKPGYYLFPNLPADTYYVEFIIPAGYKLTTLDANANADDTVDSDVYYDPNITGYRTINISVPDGVSSNLSYDLGLIADTGQSVGMSLVKTPHSFTKKDNTTVTFGTQEPVNVGETIYFNVVVTNTGTLPLHHVLVDDLMSNYTFNLGVNSIASDPNLTLNGNRQILIQELAPGQSYTFRGQYLVVPTDDNGSPLVNTVRAYANELTNKLVPTYLEDTASFDVASFDIQKTVTHIKKAGTTTKIPVANDADIDAVGVTVGDTVYYGVTVTNDGGADLSNITFIDTLTLKKVGNPTPVTQSISLNPIAALSKGSSATVEGSYVVQSNDEDKLDNKVTATATQVRTPVEATKVTSLKGLNLYKTIETINGLAPVLVNSKHMAKVGDEIGYLIRIKNTSDAVTYTNVNITDLMKGSSFALSGTNVTLGTTNIPSLAPGQTVDVPYTYTVQLTDVPSLSSKQVINSASITTDNGAQRTAEVPLEVARVKITKAANRTSFYQPGSVITYTVNAYNYSSTDLDNVLVSDPKIGLNETIAFFEKGGMRSFTGTYTVTTDDVAARRIDNTATITDDIAGSDTASVAIPYYVPSTTSPAPLPPVIEEPPVEPPVDPSPDQPPLEKTPVPQPPRTNPGDVIIPLPPEEDGSRTFVPKEKVVFIEIMTPPKKGTAQILPNGTLKYVPDQNGSGDRFEVKITYDGDEELIIIEIPENEIPLGDVLPQTGDAFPILNILAGMALLLMGGLTWFKTPKAKVVEEE